VGEELVGKRPSVRALASCRVPSIIPKTVSTWVRAAATAVVGETIAAAATDSRPALRYPAGSLARRVSKLRRFAPSSLFDKQIRKINQLNGAASATVPASERTTSSG
jgi:hypothetical protein